MRKISSAALLLTFIGVSAVLGAREQDKVDSLPLVGQPLPSNWYSGYLNVTESKSLFYVFVESHNKET